MKAILKRSVCCLAALVVAAGCTTTNHHASGQKQVLQVRWQRLVDEQGQTCERCGGTEKAINAAVKQLRRSLKGLNIDVVLVKTNLDGAAFAKAPLESNRIWVGDKPVEEWLQAKVGQSQCCGSCGDAECRTLTVDGQTYETIPSALIVKAGLLAGAQLVQGKAQNPWNPMAGWSAGAPECCPAGVGAKK